VDGGGDLRQRHDELPLRAVEILDLLLQNILERVEHHVHPPLFEVIRSSALVDLRFTSACPRPPSGPSGRQPFSRLKRSAVGRGYGRTVSALEVENGRVG